MSTKHIQLAEPLRLRAEPRTVKPPVVIIRRPPPTPTKKSEGTSVMNSTIRTHRVASTLVTSHIRSSTLQAVDLIATEFTKSGFAESAAVVRGASAFFVSDRGLEVLTNLLTALKKDLAAARDTEGSHQVRSAMRLTTSRSQEPLVRRTSTGIVFHTSAKKKGA
jgi:hypothetical protein